MSTAGVTVLVAGGTGEVGGAVARHLLGHGWRVRALVEDAEARAARRLQLDGALLERGSLEDAGGLARACEGVAAVVLAPAEGPAQPLPAGWATGAHALYRAAAGAGVRRFVLLSSLEAAAGAGAEGADAPAFGLPFIDARAPALREAARLLDAEAAALRARGRAAPGLVVLRLGAVWGPDCEAWTRAPLREAAEGRLRVPGHGRFPLAHVHVEDVARAVERAVLSPAQGAFDVVAGVTPYADFMGHYCKLAGTLPRRLPLALLWPAACVQEVLQRLTGKPRRLNLEAWRRLARQAPPSPCAAARGARAVAAATTPAPGAEARAALGWAPSVSLEEGMRRLAGRVPPCSGRGPLRNP